MNLPQSNWRTAAFPLTLACAALLGTGCSRDPVGDVVEITKTRTITQYEPARAAGATDDERFGFSRPVPPPPPGMAQHAAAPFRWKVIDGWTAQEGSQMRVANFSFGPNGEGECYLSLLPGSAGGVLANLNRWRAQMGQEPMAEEDLASLGTTKLLGADAPMLDVTGPFKGMGETEAKPDYRMLGALLGAPEFTLFVKMTGPANIVAENEDKFREFCASVEITSSRGGGQ